MRLYALWTDTGGNCRCGGRLLIKLNPSPICLKQDIQDEQDVQDVVSVQSTKVREDLNIYSMPARKGF